MHRTALAAAFSVLPWLTGCTQAPPPVPDTRAADEKALRDADAAALAAWGSKDADKVAALYADDASVAIPNAPLIQGKQAFRDGIKEAMADPNFKLDFHPTAVEAAKSGDLGFVKGVYTVVASDPKTKKATTEKGNYLIAYKKQADGSWKIINDFASPEAPAK
jgi:uncharacterized protein (TIGR02246 family)